MQSLLSTRSFPITVNDKVFKGETLGFTHRKKIQYCYTESVKTQMFSLLKVSLAFILCHPISYVCI